MTAESESPRPFVNRWTRYGRLWLVATLASAAMVAAIRIVSQAETSPETIAPGHVPARMLSVNIMSDEILLALAPERLIGLSVLADDPDSSNIVREAAAVPARVNADSEQILMQSPDFVAIGGHSADVARQIEGLGISLFRIRGFESIEWIRLHIGILGAMAGVPEQAERLIADMNRRIDAVSARVAGRSRPRVLLYSASGWVSGRQTTLDDAISASGGINVAAEMGIVGGGKIPQERVIMADPDVILIRNSRKWDSGFRQSLLHDPAFQGVKAVREQRVYSVQARLLVTSSHHIAETVEMIARLLHPDAFPETAP